MLREWNHVYHKGNMDIEVPCRHESCLLDHIPAPYKDELIDCVRADFVLDWDLDNHRKTVSKQLCKRFNAFHHQLHKKYLAYSSHEEALANGCVLLDPLVWVKLCGRWESQAFKSPTSNLVEIYKEVRWSKKKDQFVSPTTEELYHKMVGKLSDLEPEVRTVVAVAGVFRDVLGHKSGYAKGLGEMIMSESTQKQDRERDKQYVEVVKEAAYYKNEIAELRGDVRVLLERQQEYDKLMNMLMSERQSREDSLPTA